MKLTKADRIILRNIEYDAKIFEKKLAKKCNLSKDSIRYRINRLKKFGVIGKSKAFIDYTSLGYKSYKLYLKLSATLKQKKQLRDFLSKQREIFAVFESKGNWDMAIALFTKTRKEYYEFENILLFNFGDIIYSKKFCLMLDAELLENNLLYNKTTRKNFSVWKENLVEIDKKDKKILNELHKDGKQNLVSLSEKIGLSIDSVNKRMKKLVGRGVISFFNTAVDYSKLGYEKYKLFIYVKNYSQDKEKKVLKFLNENPHTINYIKILGPWKLECEFLIKEHKEFDKILSELQEKFSDTIQKLEFSIFGDEIWFPSDKILE